MNGESEREIVCVFCKYVCGTVCGVEWKRCSFHRLGIHWADLHEWVQARGAALWRREVAWKCCLYTRVCVFLINCSWSSGRWKLKMKFFRGSNVICSQLRIWLGYRFNTCVGEVAFLFNYLFQLRPDSSCLFSCWSWRRSQILEESPSKPSAAECVCVEWGGSSGGGVENDTVLLNGPWIFATYHTNSSHLWNIKEMSSKLISVSPRN